ncbi:MAG: class I SAM-dependent methyltransferase [Oscillospiraceae bacterium]|nr:class I SAM-dependent methyltransferase [Oscillospiraceae bacterium]
MTNESMTLFIPLYGKAMMSREGFYNDKKAEEIYRNERSRFNGVDTSKKLAVYMTMRAMQYDSFADDFIAGNPFSAVVHLGCGLDSRCLRVKNKAAMWYDIDLEDVINLRRKFYPASDTYKMFISSAVDPLWLKRIKHSGEPVLVIAEGLSMYLEKDEIIGLLKAFAAEFPRTLFIFDAYSESAAKLSKFKNPVNAVDAKISFSIDSPEPLIEDIPSAEVVLNNDIILDEYIEKLTGVMKTRFKFMKKTGNKLYRIFGIDIKGNLQ